VTSVLLSQHDMFIISASQDRSIKVFDMAYKKQVFNYNDIHEGIISSIAISADASLLVSGSQDKSIKMFDFKTKQQIYHFKDNTDG